MYAMTSMTTEFFRNNGTSEPGGAEGSVAVRESPAEVGIPAVAEEIPRGAVPTAGVTKTTAAVEAAIGRSESGSAEGNAAVGESSQRAIPNAVRDSTAGDDTVLCENYSCNS